jgi:hypothetical protein
MKNFEEFNRETVNFCKLYNLSVSPDEDIKNRLFCRFYGNIAEAADVPSSLIKPLKTIIFYLCTMLHEWDNLVEEEGIKESTYKTFIDRMHHRESSIKEAVQQISLPSELFNNICKSSMEKIKDYFLLEEEAMKFISSEQLILTLLKKGNCDFEFYNDIFFKLLKEEYREGLTSFFENYLIVDLIADHITDLKEDIENFTYNPLLLLYRLYKRQKSPYIETCKALLYEDSYTRLCRDNIMDWFTSLADKEIREAEKKLEKINPPELKNLLSLYLNGISEGFSLFKKYDCLTWMEKDRRDLYITLMLKPHPWERLTLNDIG